MSEATAVSRAPAGGALRHLGRGLLAFLAAVPLAYGIHLVNAAFSDRPERAIMVVGAAFALLLGCPLLVYLAARRREAVPEQAAQLVFLTVAVLLLAGDLYWIGGHVAFPADILIWSESDFVNDILKLRVGYPLYTPQVNNDSFVYLPGAQVLTGLIASAVGKSGSIPVYRLVQVLFTVLTAMAAVLCGRTLMRLSAPEWPSPGRPLWEAAWLPVFFLLATNPVTNPFVQDLHNDALSQLISVVAFWLLLTYIEGRQDRVLVAMAVLPALGFLVKQSLVIWAIFYAGHLLVFDRPRSLKRVLFFTLAAFGLIGTVVGACFLRWGHPFLYWAFSVLGSHGVSPLRAFQHVLDTWVYFTMGILGGIVLLRGPRFPVLLGPWLIWLAYLGLEAYTSGIAWMLNHLGPGCLLAGVWLVTAVTTRLPQQQYPTADAEPWLRATGAVAVAMLLLGGLGTIRIPSPSIPPDAYRYVARIEKEFEGQRSDRILLDAGTWVYQSDGVIMKDRAPSIGERGYSETGDFSGILGRIAAHRYDKILVRNFDRPDFWYDYWLWRKRSGIRQALLDYYRVSDTIPAVKELSPDRAGRYLFGDITVLVPQNPIQP